MSLLPPWLLPFVWRDLRSGVLRWLMLAVALSVAALSSVSLFADRIERGLQRDAAQLLGADLVLLGDQPLPEAWQARAQSLGLRTAQTAVFPSMARADDAQGGQSRLVAVKAVSDAYPLRGRVTLHASQAQAAVETPAAPGGPAPGTVWVDAGVLLSLRLQVGDMLWLGDRAFRVAATMANEPDRGAGFVNFSPRVMMRWADLPSTGLIQPASRVTWRLLVAGQLSETTGTLANAPQMQRFTDWARQQVPSVRGARLETLQDGRPEMRATLDRAGTFLRLVAMLAVLMSAVVVAMVARDFAAKRLDDAALLRVLGVTQRRMVALYVAELVLVALVSALAGLALGALCQQALVLMLADLVKVNLPWPSWQPFGMGLLVAVMLALGFGLPPLIQLAHVPALRVMRRDIGQLRGWTWFTWALGVGTVVAMLALSVQQPKLAGIALGGVMAAVVVLALLGALLLKGLSWLLHRPAGQRMSMAWRHAIQALVAQPWVTIMHLCTTAIGLMAIFLLVLVRGDLLDSWRMATPPDAPNRFVINIQPDQVESFQSLLKQGGADRFDWYPMARARLLAINGRVTQASDFADERAQRLVEREFNLSHAAAMPDHNTLVGGQFRATADPAQELSLEEGLAKTLGIRLGDSLTFDMAGQTHTWRVTSLRKVNWASMRVNFFAMVPVAQAPSWPVTYISAFKQPAVAADRAVDALDQRLVREFPNLTVVDVSQSIQQVQRVLVQVMQAVEFLFGFTLLMGVLVLLTGLWSSRDQRRQTLAVMRALGASRQHLQRVQQLELVTLGALAGAVAAVAALAVAWALASQVFEFPWQPPWWGLVGGVGLGAGLVLTAGWWSLRDLLNKPVLTSLRQVV